MDAYNLLTRHILCIHLQLIGHVHHPREAHVHKADPYGDFHAPCCLITTLLGDFARIVKSVSVLEQLIMYNLIGGNTLKLK